MIVREDEHCVACGHAYLSQMARYHTPSLDAPHAVRYSASTEDNATAFYFCDCQLVAPPAAMNTQPVTDSRSSTQAA